MRILHVNKFLYRRGGAEAYMLDVAALQAAAGHEISFFGMAHPDNDRHVYEDWFPASVEFDRPPTLAKKVTAAGRMLYSPSARLGMRKVMEHCKPDVVHLHNIYHQLSPSVLAPVRRLGVPAVMTLHDYKLACPTYLMLDKGQLCEACVGRRFHQAPLRRCKDGSLAASAMAGAELALHTATGAYNPVRRFICPSRFMEQKMRDARVFPERLRELPNFVDAEAVAVKSSPGGPALYAGRLSQEKGPDVLVRAIGRLGEHASLDIVGEGSMRAALEALAQEEAPGRVRFHGRVPRERVLELMRHASVLVLPSRCHENQPMTVLEASASGLPVVGSRLGGIPDVVREGVTGLLVPHDDPGALATAMDKLLVSPSLAMEMGRRARQRVEAVHAPETHLEGLAHIYAEAAAGA